MRQAEELEQAHDFLRAILRRRVPFPECSPADHLAMRVALSVLCWALEHEDNQFEENLDRLDEAIRDLNVSLGSHTH